MSPARMRKVESAMRVVLEFHEALNRHDVTKMMQLVSEDCLFENTNPAPDGTAYKGKEAITEFWQNFFQASSEAHFEIEDIFGFGERCIMRWKYSWQDPEGIRGHIRGADIYQVKNDQICEKRSYVKG